MEKSIIIQSLQFIWRLTLIALYVHSDMRESSKLDSPFFHFSYVGSCHTNMHMHGYDVMLKCSVWWTPLPCTPPQKYEVHTIVRVMWWHTIARCTSMLVCSAHHNFYKCMIRAIYIIISYQLSLITESDLGTPVLLLFLVHLLVKSCPFMKILFCY